MVFVSSNPVVLHNAFFFREACYDPHVIPSTFPTGSVVIMSQGQGGGTSENVDRAKGTWRRRRFFRHPIEEKNPSNVEFVCAVFGWVLCYSKHMYGLFPVDSISFMFIGVMCRNVK